jgi:catechol 2,3-dioxygenase-like lactoylglutathione lyase family enzyme
MTDTAPCGIHSIDHFTLEVPSLDEARRFFTCFGLDVSDESDRLALRSFSTPHIWARLLKGPARRLAYLSLNCYEVDFNRLVAQVRENGGIGGTGDYVNGNGFWFYDPDGNLIQIKPGEKTSPSKMAPQSFLAHREGERGAGRRSEVRPIRPSRLSHVLLFTSSVSQSIGFYRDALGMRLSDRSGEAIAFMHARYGCDHHLIAFAASTAKGWHHCSWEVANFDEVGLGAEQMRNAGYVEGWGTGRHVLGSNYFHYVQDPWGSFSEYSSDLDFIPEGFTWPSADFPAEDALHLWGPRVPAFFTQNLEA